MEMMDHLMAEKLTKIIKTAKWGKSHQKNIFKKNKKKRLLTLKQIWRLFLFITN